MAGELARLRKLKRVAPRARPGPVRVGAGSINHTYDESDTNAWGLFVQEGAATFRNLTLRR